MADPTEAMLKAARGWADGAEANRLRRNPGPTPHEEACFAAGYQQATADIVAELRKWEGWPEGFDGAHGNWDESDWSTPDKLADAIGRGEFVELRNIGDDDG